jgi:hypothetical protein
VVTDASGNYTLTTDVPQTSGTVEAVATDAAGNASAPVDVTYADTSAPVAPVVNVTSNADGGVTVSGTAEPGSTVTVTYPDGTSATTTADASGNYSMTTDVPQSSGTVEAVATDAAGNASAPVDVTYADTSAPAAPVVNVTPNADGGVTVSGTAEPGSTVTVTYPDGTSATTTADASGNYSMTTDVPQSSGTVEAVATDAAGNASAPVDVTYADTTAPAAPVMNVTPNADGSLTLSGTGEPGSTVTMRNPDGSSETVTVGQDGSYTVTTPPQQPSGDVTAHATDKAGNSSDDTTVSYVNLLPPFGVITVTARATADTTPTISGTISGKASGDMVWVTVNGVTYKEGIDAELTVGATSWTLAIPSQSAINVNGLSDVNLNVDALLVSAQGVSKADTTSGELTVFQDVYISPYFNSNSSTPSIVGTAEVGTGETLSVGIYSGTTLVASFSPTVTAAGSWSVSAANYAAGLGAGTYTVQASVITADGSGGQAADPRTMTLVPDNIIRSVAKGTSNTDNAASIITATDDGGWVVTYAANASATANRYSVSAVRYNADGTIAWSQQLALPYPTGASTNLAYSNANAFSAITHYDVQATAGGGFEIFYTGQNDLGNSAAAALVGVDATGAVISTAMVPKTSGRTYMLNETIVNLGSYGTVALVAQGTTNRYDLNQNRVDLAGNLLDATNTTLVADYALGYSAGYVYGSGTPAGRFANGSVGSDSKGIDATAVGDASTTSQYVIEYTDTGPSTTAYRVGMYLQLMDFNTGKLGGAVAVSDNVATRSQIVPVVLNLKEGGIQAMYVESSALNNDVNQMNLYSRHFDVISNTLVASGAAVMANTTTTGTNGVLWNSIANNAAGVALEQGGYVIVWVNSTSAATSNVYAQIYDAGGNHVGDSILVSSVDTTHLNFSPSVTALDDGGFALSWTNSQATTATIGTSGYNLHGSIYTQVYNADGTVRPATDTSVHPGNASYAVATDDNTTVALLDGAVHSLSDGQLGGVAHTGIAFVGGAGDDTIVLHSVAFSSINGAGGFNTITFGTQLQGGNVSFAGLDNIHNISDINMGDGAGTKLSLTLADVLNFTPNGNHSLMIDSGATSATLDIDEGSWKSIGTAVYHNTNYAVYTANDHTAELWVKSSISVI